MGAPLSVRTGVHHDCVHTAQDRALQAALAGFLLGKGVFRLDVCCESGAVTIRVGFFHPLSDEDAERA